MRIDKLFAGFIATVCGVAAGCDDVRCREVSAYAVDESRLCLQANVQVPELQACATTSYPTRGIRVACLVDGAGRLHLATGGDSERFWGTGWRHSDGAGAWVLSADDMQRCSAAIDSIGFPEPAKMCMSAER